MTSPPVTAADRDVPVSCPAVAVLIIPTTCVRVFVEKQKTTCGKVRKKNGGWLIAESIVHWFGFCALTLTWACNPLRSLCGIEVFCSVGWGLQLDAGLLMCHTGCLT